MESDVRAETLEVKSAARPWPLVKRVAFRFVFLYLLLYTLPFPFTLGGFLGEWVGEKSQWLAGKHKQACHGMASWVAEHILHLDKLTVFENGSGDTTYNYVLVLCYASIAAAGTLLWCIAGFRQKDHRTLDAMIRVLVRYSLAFTMIGYGFAKVIPNQMPLPDVGKLMEPYGEASPMGILWTFMGASGPYQTFAGCAEVLGGLLLFFRRTTLFGSLVCAAVLTNVVALNFCYDVPVKLYSSHLLLQAIFLAAPYAPRLFGFLVLHCDLPAGVPLPMFKRRWAYWTWFAVKLCLMSYLLWTEVDSSIQAYNTYGGGVTRPVVWGYYAVEGMSRDGAEQPLLASDAKLWRRVAIDRNSFMFVRTMDDSTLRYALEVDEKNHSVAARPLSNRQAGPEMLTYSKPDDDHLVIEGTLDAHALKVTLRRLPQEKFLLTSRGFHWINEYPYNR